jgi:hypothetical protein
MKQYKINNRSQKILILVTFKGYSRALNLKKLVTALRGPNFFYVECATKNSELRSDDTLAFLLRGLQPLRSLRPLNAYCVLKNIRVILNRDKTH